jgi:G3E family GTPase
MDLVKQLTDIVQQKQFDYIVIEASGICEPEPIARTICTIPSMVQNSDLELPRLDSIVTVVDALRLQSEFACGDKLERQSIEEDDIENLIIQQIEFCNIIVLNKISEVDRKEADRIREIIHALQPNAEIVEADYGDIDLDKILNTNMFDYIRVATSATWVRVLEHQDDDDDDDDDDHHHHDHHHDHDHEEGEAEEYGIGTFVYYTRRPFDLNKFDYMCAKKWPASVIRAKGICYFKENTDMSYMFEQAGIQKQLRESGAWFATAPEAELKQMMAEDPNIAKDWDPEYGDRMIKIVLIGQKMDKQAITSLFDSCLVE